MATGSIAQAQLDRDAGRVRHRRAALDQAKARLASLAASTSQAASRVQEASARAQQASDVDALIEQARARAAHGARAGRRRAGRARPRRARVSYTHIVAPQDGVVSKKTIDVGQMVAAGQAVVQLVPDARRLGHRQLQGDAARRRCASGQPAHVEVDAFPGVTLHGEVESFSAATGARFSAAPARQRERQLHQGRPARARARQAEGRAAPASRCGPGMSVDLTVDTPTK